VTGRATAPDGPVARLEASRSSEPCLASSPARSRGGPTGHSRCDHIRSSPLASQRVKTTGGTCHGRLNQIRVGLARGGIVSSISSTTSPKPAKARPEPRAREETTGGIEAILCGVVRTGMHTAVGSAPQARGARSIRPRREGRKRPHESARRDGERRQRRTAHGSAEGCARRLRLPEERVRGCEDSRIDTSVYGSDDWRAIGSGAAAASPHESQGARYVSIMMS
jgi:hypothetical protein